MDNVVARFNEDSLRYVLNATARTYEDHLGNKHRKPHLFLICFQYDGDRFHSDFRLGRWNVSQRFYS